MSESNYQPPEETASDRGAAMVRRGLLGAIPVFGQSAIELFETVFQPSLEQRRGEWMNAIAEGLRRLECDVDELKDNQTFIDTTLQATQAAIRTANQEKREALRNAVLNSALTESPDESRQQVFVALVDQLTPWHLRILRLFANPAKWFQENQRQLPEYSLTSSLSQLLCDAYPDLANEREFYDQIATDLYNRGLFTAKGLHTAMSASGAFAERATLLGKQFLAFISSPLRE